MKSQISTAISRIFLKRKCASYLLSVLISVALPVLAQAETIEISIKKMLFMPENVTINPGDTVRWVNDERRQYHSVWFEALGVPEPDYFFPGEFFEKRFVQAGSYPYRCGPHSEMLGTVIVREPGKEKASHANNHTITFIQNMEAFRQEELVYLLKQDCGSCHGMTLKGGLGPSLVPEKLASFSIEDLAAVIMEGRPGTPMPPWKGILKQEEASWIGAYLKSGLGVGQ